MCDVRGSVDLMSAIDELDLEIPRDYVPFFDSTMARFKIGTARARNAIEECLGRMPSGRILSAGELRDLGVSFPDGRFGDVIYLADPGVIILPSHMGREGVAAMHGYHPDTEEMCSALFSNDEPPAADMALSDVAAFMLPGFDPGHGRERP
jgi:hypothetical protein